MSSNMGMVNIFGAVKAGMEVFKAGKEVADPATWKIRAVKVNALAGFISALLLLAKQFGVDLHVPPEAVPDLAAGIFALFNFGNAILLIATTREAGLPSKSDSDSSSTDATGGPIDPPNNA